jgi:hypothetical protein
MSRPDPGTRVVLPTGSFEQECIVLAPEEDAFGLVAARTTRQYTTRDQFNWSVRHPKGEKVFFKPYERNDTMQTTGGEG